MSTLHTLANNPQKQGSAVSLPLLLMALLALSLVGLAACSERTAPGDTAGTPPASSPPGEHGAHGRAAADAMPEQDSHSAHAVAGTPSAALPATPWPSDPALREGMRRMHRAVEALGHAEHDHLDAVQTAAAAQQVQAAAQYMIANCRLDPEPDAALHGLLATLMTGAAAIKADPANTAPVARMREALTLYPRMFEDPAWEADTSGAN